MPVREGGVLRVVAAAAAAFGIFAAVTNHSAAALLAGLCAAVAAVLALWSPETPAERETAAAIDLRMPPAPERQPEVAAAPVRDSAHDPDAEEDLSAQLLEGEFLETTLRGRIAIARRALRPLSVVHILIVGSADGPVPAGLVAAAAEATLRESDVVVRRDDGVYVAVLEDTGEDGAVWTTERLRRHIAGTIGPRRFQAGVASYPSHGLDAESVQASAAAALVAAQEWDRDRIEVAVH
ncbi:hypothetical protein [Actinospongicola halichondriae]|uniref:hypothetical protein n=1 Tax=Actinospongicola halichondriae TaxID=3236844 RepID=UPI003D3F8B24